jgi:hypothetical protein
LEGTVLHKVAIEAIAFYMSNNPDIENIEDYLKISQQKTLHKLVKDRSGKSGTKGGKQKKNAKKKLTLKMCGVHQIQ